MPEGLRVITALISDWQLPNFYHPPTVDTLASSLFRPRRDTSVFGGVFYCAVIVLKRCQHDGRRDRAATNVERPILLS